MKISLFSVIIVFFFCLQLNAQVDPNSGDVVVHYGYDSAGNRTSKMVIIYQSTSADSEGDLAALSDQADQTDQLEEESQVVSNSELRAYPNPAHDILFLEHSLDILEKHQYSLTDASGNLLREGLLTDQTIQINIRSLASGTYFLKIDDGADHSWEIIKR